MKNNIEFNYYQLSLLSFLLESHPALANDISFIKQRASLAAKAEEQALLEGLTQSGASEISNQVLFEGLHFSKFDPIKNILSEKFSDRFPEELHRSIATVMQPECEAIFAKYQPQNEQGGLSPFADDFAATVDFDLLEDELTSHIKTLLDSYGIQQSNTSKG